MPAPARHSSAGRVATLDDAAAGSGAGDRDDRRPAAQERGHEVDIRAASSGRNFVVFATGAMAKPPTRGSMPTPRTASNSRATALSSARSAPARA